MERTITEMKDHEAKLLQQQMEMKTDLVRVEERQKAISDRMEENQQHTTQFIAQVERNLLDAMRTNVDGRIGDLANVVNQQQELLNKVLQIQGKQAQQIDSIQTTLERFTSIESDVRNLKQEQTGLEARVNNLEQNYRDIEDLNKEKVKGRWAAVGSFIAAISAVACAIIAAIC